MARPIILGVAGGEAALARKQRDDAIRNSKHAAISQAPAAGTAG